MATDRAIERGVVSCPMVAGYELEQQNHRITGTWIPPSTRFTIRHKEHNMHDNETRPRNFGPLGPSPVHKRTARRSLHVIADSA